MLGLLWLAVGTASSLIALFGMYFVREGNLPSGPSLIFLLIAGASTLVAMSTPFGTTLLGISAIGHIRRSGGRRYGLPLALFDALFFPLLLLDLVIVVLIMLMFAPGPGDAAMRAFAIGAILAITTDVFVVRRAWQRVRVPLPPGRIKHPAPSPSPRYEMHPRRPVILYIVLGAVALVIALIVVALALPMVMRRRQAPTSSPAILAPYIAGETASEQPNGEQAYRLAVHGPEGCRASFWLEFLREGKRVDEPGFNLEHWVIPQASLPFDGHVELTLQPGLRGYSAVWRIEGNAGTMSSTEAIDWPLRDMAVRDTTWGQSTGAWAQAVIGQPLPLFVLRGGREMLLGQPGEIQADHPPDVAVRLMARFDPVSADEARHGPRFGKSPARHADDALPTVPTPEFSPPAADPLRPPMGVPGSGSPKQTPDDPRLGAPGYRYRPGSRQPVAVPTPALPAPGAEGSGDRTREVDPQPRALPPSGPEPDTGREPAQPEAAPTAPLAPTPQASPPGAPSGARR